jgi:hypothetical protein
MFINSNLRITFIILNDSNCKYINHLLNSTARCRFNSCHCLRERQMAWRVRNGVSKLGLCLLGILFCYDLKGYISYLKISFVLTFFNLWKKNIVHQLGSGKRTSDSYIVSMPYQFPSQKNFSNE